MLRIAKPKGGCLGCRAGVKRIRKGAGLIAELLPVIAVLKEEGSQQVSE